MNYSGRKMSAKCDSVYIVKKSCKAISTREREQNQTLKKKKKKASNTVALDYLKNMKKIPD